MKECAGIASGAAQSRKPEPEMVHLGSILHGPVFMVVTTIVICAGAILIKVWWRHRGGADLTC
jgi:hypothetical protein